MYESRFFCKAYKYSNILGKSFSPYIFWRRGQSCPGNGSTSTSMKSKSNSFAALPTLVGCKIAPLSFENISAISVGVKHCSSLPMYLTKCSPLSDALSFVANHEYGWACRKTGIYLMMLLQSANFVKAIKLLASDAGAAGQHREGSAA